MRNSLALLSAVLFCLRAEAAPTLPASAAERDAAFSPSAPTRVVNAALAMRGSPYESGGSTLAGVDCSGLVFRAFLDGAGTAVSRSVRELFQSGSSVEESLHIADLLFFDTADSAAAAAARDGGGPDVPTHVGVYIGDGRFVHSISEGSPSGVTVSSLSEPYYQSRFVAARRLVVWQAELPVTLLDSPRATQLEGPFASREPLTVLISSEMTGGGPVEVVLARDGEETLVAHVAPSARRPSRLAIVPEEGSWVLRVTRLFRGRELGRVAFRVEE